MLFTIVSWNKLKRVNTADAMSVSLSDSEIVKYNNLYDMKNLTYNQLTNEIKQRVSRFDREFFVVVQSNCEEINNAGKHYGMFEFDMPDADSDVSKDYIIKKLDSCSLSGYIYKTTNGFHVITTQTFDNILDLIGMGKELGCCDGYLRMCGINGFGGLRVGLKVGYTKDIKYVGTFGLENKSLDINSPMFNLVSIHDYINKLLLENVYLYKDSKAIQPCYIVEFNGYYNGQPIPDLTRSTYCKVTGYELDENGDYIEF